MPHPAALLLLGTLLGVVITHLVLSPSSTNSVSPTPVLSNATSRQATDFTGVLGDGCRYVFLDLGANVGVQARKLYEQEKYNISAKSIMNHFNQHFGTKNREEVCVFAFEPNPLHTLRLREMEAVYNSLGYRYKVFPAAVSTINTTFNLKIPVQNDFQQAAHLVKADSSTFSKQQLKRMHTVQVIDFIEFMRNHIAPRSWEGGGQGKVLCKMDIEGEEYNLLPALLTSGMMCHIDSILVEYHGVTTTRDLITANLTHNEVKQMIQTIRTSLPVLLQYAAQTCKTVIQSLDDEKYGVDYLFNTPLPLFPGADSSCSRGAGGKRCTLTRPPKGMVKLAFNKAIFGSVYKED